MTKKDGWSCVTNKDGITRDGESGSAAGREARGDSVEGARVGESAVGAAPVPSPPEQSLPDAAQRRRVRWWGVTVAGVVVVAAVGGVTWWAMHRLPAVDLEAGLEWHVRSRAHLKGADFNYETGEFDWGGTGLVTGAQQERRDAEFASAMVEAEQKVCEEFAEQSTSPSDGASGAVPSVLRHAQRQMWTRIVSRDVSEALDEAEAAADAYGFVLDDVAVGSDAWTSILQKRSKFTTQWMQDNRPEQAEKHEEQTRRYARASIESYTEQNVAQVQRLFVERCDISTPAGWKPQTAAELEIKLSNEGGK